MIRTAYSKGFNDYVDGLYHNPYSRTSMEWHAYVTGFEDARRAKIAERIYH